MTVPKWVKAVCLMPFMPLIMVLGIVLLPFALLYTATYDFLTEITDEETKGSPW